MLSNFVGILVLFLPPSFNLASVILVLCASLAPVPLLHNFALLTVTPSTSPQSQSLQSINGSIVWIGLFGSCARSSNSAPTICTKSDLFPQYDLSTLVLPADAPTFPPPPAGLTISAIISITLGFLFFLSVSLLSLYCESGKAKAFIEKPLVIHLILFIGIISSVFGITSFLLLRLWFANAGRTFNSYMGLHEEVPNLKASLGNGFIFIWIGYGLLVPPLIETIIDYRDITKALHQQPSESEFEYDGYK